MEPREPAAAQKSPVEGRDKAPLQRKWASEPSSAGSKRSTFADPDAKRHSHRESLPCGAGGGVAHNYAGGSGSVKLLSSTIGQSSQDSPYAQAKAQHQAQGFPQGYPYQLSQPYPQKPMQERFLSGAKPQPGLEPHAWPFAGQLPSEDLYPGHSRPHGAGFPRQKSPSLPSSFSQYSQSGPEPPEEGYKKEQKPKKPGKYICHYCGRACAKPSVLKKHIRSHTGERPYPCVPCGFSFKTKSNLYKHRKSHAHAIKAGLVPFFDMGAGRGDVDQASSLGEAQSDGEQSTDTDEEGVEASMLLDKGSPVPQISFESDKRPMDKGGEPAYADAAEELALMSMKVPILIVPKQGIPSMGMECPPFTDLKGVHISSLVGRGVDDSPTIKQRLALRLVEKKGQDSEQSLNLLSPHSKGSTDSGYFSRSESAEQQISPPNTNAKSYEEIMFGRTWYYRPNSRSRQSITVGMTGQDPGMVSLGKAGTILEVSMGKISEDHIFFKGDCLGEDGQLLPGVDPKQYPTGPCQSNTGLLEAPSDSAMLIRSNSMPTSSPTNLTVPPGMRGSHSFDERMTSDDVFYPGSGLRRLRRQAAFEHSAHESHGETDVYGNISRNAPGSVALKMVERSSGPSEHPAYGSYGTKVGVMENATRKRRKEKSVGDEEDSPGHCDSSCSGSVEMLGDYDCKQSSQDNSRATPSIYSAHSQSDSFDTCASMCSEDLVLAPESDRKAVGNVISVIQHTNSLSRPNSFEKSESFEHPVYQQDKPSTQYSEQSDGENIEDQVQSPESLLRSESMEQHQQSDSELVANVTPNDQSYHIPHKLVRQPNIQVPEIRVTEEPDKPEKEPEAPAKEPEKHVEEFQWPQRSETLSQLPAEKLPPKKKRLRLADLEHSSGESSFESTCTSLSRSPSQESNLSHSSSFSMSFEREEGLKSASPTKQDELARQSEFLTVPGIGHSLSIPGQHQQREMRRSSSEQAPCALPTDVPEIRSKSFDYGSLSTSSRQGEIYCSASAMKERRRGYLIRQASLSVYPETVVHETGGIEVAIKQEHADHGASHPAWPNPTTSSHGAPTSEIARSKRHGQTSLGPHHLHLQHSTSEDSQQEEPPLYQRPPRLPGQTSTEGEHVGHEVMTQDAMQYSSLPGGLASLPFLPMQPGLFWHPESTQRHKQHLAFQTHPLHKQLHIRQPNLPHALQQKAHGPAHQSIQQIQEQCGSKGDGANNANSSSSYPFPSRASPQNFSPLQSQVSLTTTSTLLIQQGQPVFATQNAGSQVSLPPGVRVPVRIQTHVPSYGSVMYTSVSQMLGPHGQGSCCTSASLLGGSSKSGIGFNLAQILGQPGYPLWKSPEPLPGQLNTGIPLSLTSGTISTTDASSSSGGGKRMLSPASSLELFIETKQQKRVKEERMYGQIVKELSAVELSTSKEERRSLKSESSSSMDEPERMSSSPPDSNRMAVRSSAPHLPEVPPVDSFTPPLQIVTDSPSQRDMEGRASSPEELDVDDSTPEASTSPQSMVSPSDTPDPPDSKHDLANKIPVNMLVQLAANQSVTTRGGTLLLTDLADVQQLFQFPSLRTTTSVSWCFLNYTKPNNSQTTPMTSVYGSWCVSSYNPNPLSLSTKAMLALLCSKQRRNTETYTMAALGTPGEGKLVSSLGWKQRIEQVKPEQMQKEVSKYGKKMKSQMSRERSKEEHGEKENSSKQAEPTRIKIFEGGYKSNEDYVYVRGRGRGKYICEECGIRCKKPSMLKKHIRTHTDVRPYVCKFCNFAFKTKGNLTKHMKSKAHMKKCLELGVSSVEELETEDTDNPEDGQRDSGKMAGIMSEHQFSDADDSDGGEEDGDEIDDDDEDDDEYDGDSTPKTRSRSTSPLPYGLPSLSITSVAASHGPSHSTSTDLLAQTPKPGPLFGYLTTLPSIQITSLSAANECPRDHGQMAQYQRLLQGALGEVYRSRLDVPSSMDEDPLSTEHSSFDPSSSRLSSPGLDSSPHREASPTSRRYLSPRRDLSPRGRLSPRRDASPLRHVSPKRDLAFRRDLSPRGHLSPLSHPGRPVSPGRDLAVRRELSPRSRHRGMIRPVSPRRGSHHHSAPWSLGQHLPTDLLSSQRSRSATHTDKDQRRKEGNQDSPSPPHQVLYSHLPLHSQVQLRSPFPMIPIGGIQMVHSLLNQAPGHAHQSQAPGHAHQRQSPGHAHQRQSSLLLQKSTSEESNTSETSCHMAEGQGVKGSPPCSCDLPQQERLMTSASPAGHTPGPASAAPEQTGQDRKYRHQRQEENIHTCTKAIASLCIASEESPSSTAATDPPHGPPSPLPAPLESGASPTRIQHFTGSPALLPPHPSCADIPLPIASKSGGGCPSLGTAGGQTSPYSPGLEERALGQQCPGDRPTSTKRSKELSQEESWNS